MLKQNMRFSTAKRILLPLNTSGDTIGRRGGTHWILAELDITCDEVHLYDWLTNLVREWRDKFQIWRENGATNFIKKNP